jgi:CHAT domain-containing protein
VQSVLEDTKLAELRDYFGDSCLAEQSQISVESVPNAVVVYPVLLEDRVELLVGADGRLERYASPASPADLEREARRLRQRLADRTTNRFRRTAEQLYDWLIRPIEARLDGEGRALVFVPSGALYQIPIGALLDRSSGRFLVQRLPVAITPGLQLTDPAPIALEDLHVLVAGISTPPGEQDPLTFVETEIEAIATSFPATRLLNERFTEASLERAFDSRPYGIVHIATHGEFNDRSGISSLLTHDGSLTMDRLSEIVARARYRIERPLDLLTLSACETAVGDDRAALGLAGVAVRAGARSAVATLWRVDDRATSRLIGRFYGELANGRVSRGEALRRAQLELLGDAATRHPYYWAPFVLVNSWL